jgi:hypothetical protein
MKRWIPVVLAVLTAGVFALAQGTPVIANQGKPGAYGAWPVSVASGSITVTGTANNAPAQCTSTAHKTTSVGVAAGTTPSTQLASRRYLVLCNSLQNSGNPMVKCRADGTPPVMAVANAGDVLGVGDCLQYNLAAATTLSCIADVAATNVTSFECVTP